MAFTKVKISASVPSFKGVLLHNPPLCKALLHKSLLKRPFEKRAAKGVGGLRNALNFCMH